MIILGVDPGTAITGYGVVQTTRANSLKVLGYGAICTSSDKKVAERLALIYQGVREKMEEFSPDCLVVEQLFFSRNVATAMPVGQARGVIILASAHYGIPFVEYSPSQVKQAVTGQGRATKEQVAYMVKMLLTLKETPKPDDVTDALAVGICHANNRRNWGESLDSKP